MNPNTPRKTKEVILQFQDLLHKLAENKPNDRSSQDRSWAVTITEVEKAYAYFCQFVGLE